MNDPLSPRPSISINGGLGLAGSLAPSSDRVTREGREAMRAWPNHRPGRIPGQENS